jgi:putative ABC transport system permease protein
MKFLWRLTLLSALNRRWTLGLTLAAVALSVALVLGVERVRDGARSSFVQSVSGTDLIIGARTGAVQLMLYSVFRIGSATNNMGWNSYQILSKHPAVAWSIPLSLGDSHRGYPVLGTNTDYFTHFRYADAQALRLNQGRPFEGLFEVVLGAEIARGLGYQLGQSITLTHGGSAFSETGGSLQAAAEHANKPFKVVGILAPTGTPVDRTAHVTLESMSAIHLDWQGGAPVPGLSIPAEFVGKFELTPKEITAVLVGLKSRADVFRMQRFINGFRGEPLLAAMPGVTLDELWTLLAVAERTLQVVSLLVVAVGLAGLVAVVLASLNDRRRELAILRSVGARPRDVFTLLLLEGAMVTAVGIVTGIALLTLAVAFFAPWLQASYGLSVASIWPATREWQLAMAIWMTGLAASLIPALRAYRMSLSDGLTPRT